MSTARRNTLLCRTLCQMPYHVGLCFKGHRCSTMTSCAYQERMNMIENLLGYNVQKHSEARGSAF